MAKQSFEIKSEGIDVERIMAEIDERIARKKKEGLYDKYDLKGIHDLEVKQLSDDREFLDYYLNVIRQTHDIDIGDFPIYSKGGVLGKPAVLLKKIIWNLLKFYTYRLFSQQKEFNAQITNAVISLNEKMDRMIAPRQKQDSRK